MSLPKDPEKRAIYLQKLSDAHKGKEPGNKGKPSPFQGKTYEEIGRGPNPLTGIPRPDWVVEKLKESQRKRYGWTSNQQPAEERRGPLDQQWKKIVKKRDNHTCQGCGIKQKEIPRTGNPLKDRLHAHHIKSWKEFPESRFDVTNGITYCFDCHWKAENFQITVPDSMPLPAPKQKRGWPKGKKRGSATYERTEQHRLESKVLHLLKKALSATAYKGGRPKGIPAWNKDKTNIEIFGEEKAAKLASIQAENARRTRNRLGTENDQAA